MKNTPRLFGVLLLACSLLYAAGVNAATAYNQFVPANGILKGSTTTAVTTAATWSDVQALLSGTCNSSVFVRADGTCVAVSLTANVSGTLPVANGGTNLTSATDDTVMVGNGTTWQAKALTDCDGATNAVTYDVTTNVWGCNSIVTSITGAALTKTDDTNVTVTLGGSPTTALVNAASLTLGWTGTLATTRGGTGVASLGTLTKADDTNVTLTLGGTPTGALINSTSITAGWTGTLAASRGGLGMSTVTDDTVAVANGSTWQSKAITDCDASGSALTYDTTTNAFACNTLQTVLTPAALTRTDDTNVTLTLGGNPSSALLNAASITAGWTGTLAASRGGLGMSTVTDDTLAVANGSTWQSKAVPDCTDSSGNHLNYTASTNAFSCGTTASTAGANPSASVGLTAVNGSATTYLRSDGAPALSQSIVPTWTGIHTFSATPVFNAGITVNASTRNVASLASGAQSYGNTTDNPTYTFLGTGTLTTSGLQTHNRATGSVNSQWTDGTVTLGYYSSGSSTVANLGTTSNHPLSLLTNDTARAQIGASGGITVGSPTGGNQGNGTVNATGLYINGTAVDAGSELVGTFTGTLTGVSGTVNCSMKYRKVGNFVTLYIASGTCSGTSNAGTLTMTGLPAAIQAALGWTAFSPACLDNGTGLLTGCLASATASSGTMTLSIQKASLTTGIVTYDGSGWTAASTKGLNTNWVIQYQTGG